MEVGPVAVPPRIDLTDVKAALTTRAVLEFYGWKFKKSGDEFESTSCPLRSDHSRRALVINSNTGRWQCFPCGTSGDLFDFIAEVEREHHFPAVIEKAAEIAGVGPSQLSDDERRARLEEWKRKTAEAEERERREKIARNNSAVGIATNYWNQLPRESERGLSYLASRYVDEVVEISDCVRFDPDHDGSPSVALFNSAGQIWSVVARRYPDLGEPKTKGLYRCPSRGTLIDPVSSIESDRDVVLVEGVFDALTARLAWHKATIIGAHGADNLPLIARVAAPIIVRKRTRLIVVPHRDAKGFERSMNAIDESLRAGLSLMRGTLSIAKHPEKDLNDSWRAGWRP